ncbi:tyrosine--tRNA ligase [Tenacibaculum piscium]|uniref:tyrosine--tRNA ligase n=1 Tax=Tenacibaculum piscium TaxID=1458515 RepID=UPI001F02B658|nr:tyrosine--tRNA ligase [Tenacibaculum piscium]
MDTINKLKENVAIILPEKGLEEKLQEVSKENRKLIIKLGFDPTAPDLHLGHAVVLKKLREFQDLGHHIIILVGSFTAKIGDPTGKNKSRKPLSTKEVQYNSETYLQQLAKIIELSKAEIVYNSEWLETLSFSDVIQLLSKVTVAQLMHRNDFNKRFTENTPIAMHELVYPILQGYDSVKIKADIEMGGTDQLFNCTMGRQIQQSFNMSPQIIMCMPLLRGLDGKEKMSKSLNNTIGLTDEPTDIFGKTMSISDDLIPEFLKLTADFSVLEKQAILKRLSTGENPMEIKKIIAKNIIKQYYNEQVAKDAELFFINQFQSKKAENKAYHPVNLKSIQAKENIITLTNLCSFLKNDLTKSAIKRLIISGAIQVNSQKITDPQTNISLIKEMKIKIGKRSFYELK